MVIGIGVDIVSLSRIKSTVEGSGKVFLDKVFTSGEQKCAFSHPDQIEYFAITFAAKEAIFKCFGIDWETGVKLTDIEIEDGKYGEPIPVLTGEFATLARKRNVGRVLLSISYETDYAVAVAALVDDKES